MAADMRAIQPESLYKLHLECEERPDGRKLDAARATVVTRGGITTADGSAFCRSGHTSVLCGIKAEVCTPATDAPPDRGWVVPNLELPALCHHRFRPGPPSEAAQTASAQLLQLLDASGALDRTQLCIEAGQAVWVLYCDLICLSHDCNVLDVALLALSAALTDLRLPSAEWDATEERLRVKPAERTPLKLGPLPLAATLAVFDKETLVLDPAGDEEMLCEASVTVAWAGDSMVLLDKTGGCELSLEAMDRCIALSKKRSLELKKLLDCCTQSGEVEKDE
ncbi:exosome complex component RRP43-like [Amphibalanus amphitrite]|uniref:exosome complex component RRP43-like n=1 Tax=Amphibalanus amphitrite TaxID=1232801 RepID=UPI001C907DB8|nr:exosome complex component RRP43-like [Amphibalanus amphitrite]XP_043219517.1 exosome complex component RRP43-like [Amphibalanus amphitrite]XP_043219519.1 exosome complex component RRP43-like [Amphibalanus amphitrite]